MVEYPRHFHIATEGLLSNKTFTIATLGFWFFDIDIVIEERGGRGGISTGHEADKHHVIVFHIKFKGGEIHKQYEHILTPNSLQFAIKLVEKFNSVKLFVRRLINKRTDTSANIKNVTLTSIKQTSKEDE